MSTAAVSSRAYLFPGQGSQYAGMGAGLFDRHRDLVARADAVLGYSVEAVCLEQPIDRLRFTEYTQPAMFVLSAMSYHEEVRKSGRPGEWMAGHSLGEYSALYAAGACDFETALEMVKIRGEISGRVTPGAMAAVLGLHWTEVERVLRDSGYDQIFVANYNSPRQLVLTGAAAQIERARETFEQIGDTKYIQLPIRGAFHSPFMQDSAKLFLEKVHAFPFRRPRVPVIANATARPFPSDRPETFAALLANQLTQPVRWMDTIQFLRTSGVEDFFEAGPGDVLQKLNRFIFAEAPAVSARPAPANESAARLGSAAFCEDYACRFAYTVGGLEPGLATIDSAIASAREGVLTFFTPSSTRAAEFDQELSRLAPAIAAGHPLGISVSQLLVPDIDAVIGRLERRGIRNLEIRDPVAGTPGMASFRRQGGRILVRTGRLDVAVAFLSVATDITVRVDFSESVDSLYGAALLPMLLEQRDGGPSPRPRIGLGEGVGTPRGVAGAFLQGADFVMTVGVNVCGRDAALCPGAKDLLQAAGPQDFVFAPDGFDADLGVRRSVLGRGVLFPRRAQYLFEMSRAFRQVGELKTQVREMLEDRFVKQPVAVLLRQAADEGRGESEVASLARHYLVQARHAAIHGSDGWSADYSIPGDSGLGAWNVHARDTDLAAWQDRTPEKIACHLMTAAGALLGLNPQR